MIERSGIRACPARPRGRRAAPLPAHFSRLFTSSVSTSLKRPLSTALAA
ncbi:Uncharacterised protein [Acinetobacter baumannii]|nr:Uncharacterised protein [Acinetobacter baumannii]